MSDIKISQLNAAQSLDPNAIIPIIQADPDDNGTVKNFSAKASQFSTGVQLIGKLIGADLNLANTAVIGYTEQTGFAFQVGDTITDTTGNSLNTTGATATIVSVNESSLTVSNINTSSSFFSVTDTIVGITGHVTFGSPNGIFQSGETVIGGTSGATGTVTSIDTGSLNIGYITGEFTAGEIIAGSTSHASSIVDTYSPPSSATISSYTFISADQPITLNGGNNYIVTDVVLTNASITPSNVNGVNIFSAPALTGAQIASVTGMLSDLVSPANYFNSGNGIHIGLPINGGTASIKGSFANASSATSKCINPIYLSISEGQGSSATADFYIYGYVLS